MGYFKQLLAVGVTAFLFLPNLVFADVVRTITFPVDGENNFSDTYGAPRSGGRVHLGTDIISAKMTPVVAAVDGRITFLPQVEPSWGYAIYIKDSDGYTYNYLHINNDTPGTDDGNGGPQYAYAPGLQRGSEVKAGQLVGWVGDSGDAEDVASHLHFEIWTPSGETINSYPSLIAALHSNVPIATYQFTRDLELGDVGPDVIELQKYLNQNGFIVSVSGAGSIGHETNYFGSATQAALIKFQKAYNIDPASGFFGPITRAIVNRLPSSNPSSTSDLQPGWLVKNNKFAEVFYVGSDYKLHWIINEEVAAKHFGSTWNQQIKEYNDLSTLGLKFGDNLL